MLREQRKPGLGIILASLKACSRLEDLQTGERIHSFILRNGGSYFHNFVGNALVDMYSKCGNMELARQVFENSRNIRDVVSWNCIIRGYAQCGQGEQALELYEQMLEEGSCEPTRVTILAALKACSSIAEKESTGKVKAWCLDRGKTIHRQALKSGDELDMKVANSLVDMYAKCGSMMEARQVFDRMPGRDVVSWNAIMMGYVQTGQADLSLEFFCQIQDKGLIPTPVTFLAALMACASLAEKGERATNDYLEKVKNIHKQIAAIGEKFTVVLASTVLDAYAKCGSMVDARNVFERMPQHNVVTCNCMVLGYARNGEGENALQVYAQMQRRGMEADVVTCLGALKACTSLAEKGSARADALLECGRAIHSQAVRSGHEDITVATSLVDMYAKCGSMLEARQVFDRMPQRDMVSWTSIILGYVQSGDTELGLKFYRLSREQGLVPDATSYVAALKACGSLAALEIGRQVHEDIRRGGLEKDVVLVNCLVDFYGKCSSMVEARQVFDSAAGTRNLVTWNTLLTGFSCQGDATAVLDIFQMMQKENVKPNDVTFLSILGVCTHSGLVDEGVIFFEEMHPKYQVPPTIDHYTCMVDMLGRANRLDDAVTMVKGMPVEADEVIWKALLAAAQKWKNAQVGKFAFEKMLELSTGTKRSSGGYVLMANAFTG